MMAQELVGLDVRLVYDAGPAVDLAFYKLVGLLWCAGFYFRTQVSQFAGQILALHGGIECLVQLIDRFGRCSRRGEQHKPAYDVEVRIAAFRNGGSICKQPGTLRGCYRQRLNGAASDLRKHDRNIVEHHAGTAGYQIWQCYRASLIRHMHDVYASRLFEELSSEMLAYG